MNWFFRAKLILTIELKLGPEEACKKPPSCWSESEINLHVLSIDFHTHYLVWRGLECLGGRFFRANTVCDLLRVKYHLHLHALSSSPRVSIRLSHMWNIAQKNTQNAPTCASSSCICAGPQRARLHDYSVLCACDDSSSVSPLTFQPAELLLSPLSLKYGTDLTIQS